MPKLVASIGALVVGVGAVATLVASEWPTLSASTYGLLCTLAGGALGVFAPSPLKGKAQA